MSKCKLLVGQNLKYLRNLYNSSVKDLAAYLEMSDNNYHKIERNEIGLSFSHASKIAELAGVSLDVLVRCNAIDLAHHINEMGKEIIQQNFEKIKNRLKPPPS